MYSRIRWFLRVLVPSFQPVSTFQRGHDLPFPTPYLVKSNLHDGEVKLLDREHVGQPLGLWRRVGKSLDQIPADTPSLVCLLTFGWFQGSMYAFIPDMECMVFDMAICGICLGRAAQRFPGGHDGLIA